MLKMIKKHIGTAFVLLEAMMHSYLVLYLIVNSANVPLILFTFFELNMFIYLIIDDRKKRKMNSEMLARIEELLADERHLIRFDNRGWTIAHPIIERVNGSLFDCEVHWDWDYPGFNGTFNLEYDDAGLLTIGELVDHEI